jgi:hypothetical protein
MPQPGYRTNTVGGVPILGGVTDAPDIVRALEVTRIIVLAEKTDSSVIDYLRSECPLDKRRISAIDLLGPLRDWPTEGRSDSGAAARSPTSKTNRTRPRGHGAYAP